MTRSVGGTIATGVGLLLVQTVHESTLAHNDQSSAQESKAATDQNALKNCHELTRIGVHRTFREHGQARDEGLQRLHSVAIV